jgi:uncharacterized OsmC-like protein
VYLRRYCEGAAIALPAFAVTLDAELVKEPPARFKEIRIAVDLKGAVMDERRRSALIDFIKNCPVHNTLKNNPAINITIG